MTISAAAASSKPISPPNHINGFQREMREYYISHECELAFRYQFFTYCRRPIYINQPHVLASAANQFFKI
jgi:hypothetical protein